MLIRSFLILLLIPKKHSNDSDCLKDYGREEIDLKMDKITLKFSNIYYVYAYTLLSTNPTGKAVIIPIDEDDLKPFKIIVDHEQSYVTLVDNIGKMDSRRKIEAELGILKNIIQGTSFCDLKIPKSQIVVKIKTKQTKVRYLLHACRVLTDDEDNTRVEKSTIVWTEGAYDDDSVEIEKLFSSPIKTRKFPMREFYEDIICECGEMMYFLSNCTDSGLLNKYIIEPFDENVVYLIIAIIAMVFFIGLSICLYIKRSALKTWFKCFI